MISGLLRRLRAGAPWRGLPERYGPWQTVDERFACWKTGGTWARLLEQVQLRDDSVGNLAGTVSVGSTAGLAHQSVAAVRKTWRRATHREFGALGGSPGAGPVLWRADHQGASRPRRPGPAPDGRRHAGQRQRLHRLRHRLGRTASAAERCRSTSGAARPPGRAPPARTRQMTLALPSRRAAGRSRRAAETPRPNPTATRLRIREPFPTSG
ncbi:transposase [Streptomyces sp. SPB074]|nr:transposase [Streptomyces sp. SPB074]